MTQGRIDNSKNETSTEIEELNSLLTSDKTQPKNEIIDITISEVLINLIPNILSNIMNQLVLTIEMIILGNMGTVYIDSLGISIAYLYVFALSISTGISSTINVLCPKHFFSENYYLLGLEISRVRILSIFFSIFIIIFHFTCGSFIIKLIAGNKLDLVENSLNYINIVIIAILIEFQSEIIKNYFESHLYYTPVIISNINTIISFIISCYILIVKIPLYIKGAAYSILISFIIKFMTYLIYLMFLNPYKESSFLCDWNTFNSDQLILTLKISILSLIDHFSETLGIHLVTMIAAKLLYHDLAKFLIIMSICDINLCFGLAFHNTSILLIGKYVGINSIPNIKKTICYLLYCIFIVHFPIVVIIAIFQNQILHLYTNDINVYSEMNILMLFCCLFMIFYIFSLTFHGIIRGFGNIYFISIVCFLGYTIIWPLSSYLITFVLDFKTYGIYISSFSVYFLVASCWIIYLVFFLDIKKICEEYQSLAKEQNSKLNE